MIHVHPRLKKVKILGECNQLQVVSHLCTILQKHLNNKLIHGAYFFQNLNTAPDAVTSKYLQPDINFCGPGMFGGAPTQQSDVFSLGMLITAVYNDSTSLIEGTGIVSELSSAKRSVSATL